LVGKLGLFFVAAEHLAAVPIPPIKATIQRCDFLIGQEKPDAILVGKLCLFLPAVGHPGAALTPPIRAKLCECYALIGWGNT
jgi:hypothetical protein